MTDLSAFLSAYARAHREAEPKDFVKLLFQGAYGGEHLVRDPAGTLARLKQEAEGLSPAQRAQYFAEALPGPYCRVNLSALQLISPEALNRMFVESAGENAPAGDARFEEGLKALESLLAGEPELFGFAQREFAAYLADYYAQGGGAVSHSERFRRAYGPAYRVVRREYVPLLPVVGAVEKRLAQKERVLVAMDGPCAGGKTESARRLAALFGGTVFHADDFFLPPAMRTPERLAEPGGNMDRERLLREVLTPIRDGREAVYRPFDCETMEFGALRRETPGALTVVEGSYTLHPELRGLYDLKVFLSVAKTTQLERLRQRESPESFERFCTRWIPLEERYFSEMHVADCADLCIDTEIFPEGRIQ